MALNIMREYRGRGETPAPATCRISVIHQCEEVQATGAAEPRRRRQRRRYYSHAEEGRRWRFRRRYVLFRITVLPAEMEKISSGAAEIPARSRACAAPITPAFQVVHSFRRQRAARRAFLLSPPRLSAYAKPPGVTQTQQEQQVTVAGIYPDREVRYTVGTAFNASTCRMRRPAPPALSVASKFHGRR